LTSSIAVEQKNPIAVFMCALKAAESRRQYPRRFRIFLDYLRLEGSLEYQAKEFLIKSKESHQWAEDVLIGFISYELERAKNRDLKDNPTTVAGNPA
jgi:hypothetical protein